MYGQLHNTEVTDELSEEDEAVVDAIVDQLMKEHPEWFSTDGNQNLGTGAYQGEHVGTPDSGDMGDYVFTQGDYSDIQGGTVY